MSLSNFVILSTFDIDKLGEGAYSSVYKIRRISDKCEYALKKVHIQNLSGKEKENALNEVRILASIKCPNVISYKEAFIDESSKSLCLIMEFADNGDLFQRISEHQKKNTFFEEKDIWKIFIQVVKGLKALHEFNIMHRDMKSANVFLFHDFTAKLGDLNVSKIAKRGLNYTQTGTPYYASPEVWKDQPYDVKSDIWSLGCVLYEMIALKPPFRAEDMAGLYKKVMKGVYPNIPSQYSNDLGNLVRQLLQVSAPSRPTCEKILRMKSIETWNDRLFPNNENIISDEQNILLKTIKFPKNILNLTSQLPKASYNQELESNKRRTTDNSVMFPDIIRYDKKADIADEKKKRINKILKIKELKEEYDIPIQSTLKKYSEKKDKKLSDNSSDNSKIIDHIELTLLKNRSISKEDRINNTIKKYCPSLQKLKELQNSLISHQLKIREMKPSEKGNQAEREKDYGSPIIISALRSKEINSNKYKSVNERHEESLNNSLLYKGNRLINNTLISQQKKKIKKIIELNRNEKFSQSPIKHSYLPKHIYKLLFMPNRKIRKSFLASPEQK